MNPGGTNSRPGEEFPESSYPLCPFCATRAANPCLGPNEATYCANMPPSPPLEQEPKIPDPPVFRGVHTTVGEAGTCGACGLETAGGPDPCLGYIPGVSHACCGHGGACEPYVVIGGEPDQDCATIDSYLVFEGRAASAFFALVKQGTVSGRQAGE